MTKPRPKTFRAVRPFSAGATHYQPGDIVPHGTLLARLIRWGGFVTDKPEKKE